MAVSQSPVSPESPPGVPRRSRLPSPAPLRGLLPRLRPYRGVLALAALCLVLAAAIGLAFPQVVRHLLDSAFQVRDRRQLDRIALALVGLFALQGVFNFVQVFLLTGTTERVIAQLREDVFAHLVRLSPAFFTEHRSGELTSRMSADLGLLQSMLSTWVSELARQGIFLVGGLILLTRTHPSLTTTTLAVVPIVVGFALVFGRRLRAASAGVQDRVADAMATADEAFSEIRVVQSFTREAAESRRFASLLRGVVDAALRRAFLRALFFGVVGFVAFAGVVAVLWQGGRLVLAGQLTAGTLVSFLLYAIFIAGAIGSLASLFGSYQEAIGAATRVFHLLDTVPTVLPPRHPHVLRAPVRGEIVFEGVDFRYATDLPEVLTDVSFRVAPGEVVALVGPSGAGKTTIASLIQRFWDPTAGRILLDGVDIRELSFADLRGAIGLVPQEPVLFSGSVRENIAYASMTGTGTRARTDLARKRTRDGGAADDSDAGAVLHGAADDGTAGHDAAVDHAAAAAHAAEFIARLPDGLDTRVGERGVKLSGGQRQRIAIARVFHKDPAVVLLDEATSNLDTESERLIEDAMGELLRGRTTLIIAHRLSTVLRADRVLVLEHGRIVEEGRHADLVRQRGVYARLYA